MSKLPHSFWLFASVVALVVGALFALRILTPHADKRVSFIDADHIQVEFLYGDCFVTERHTVTERKARPLYPSTSTEKAERRWKAEFGSDMKLMPHEEEIPPGAKILLDEAKPVLPEVFNDSNASKFDPPFVPNGLPNPFADEVKK